MGIIGTIKEITTEDDRIVATVKTGNGREISAVVYGLAGVESYPLIGDWAIVDDSQGRENAVLAIVSDNITAGGETVVFGRDADGNIVSKITCKADGAIRGENDNGFFELGTGGQFNANDNLTVDP
jgi:hypothetical protein